MNIQEAWERALKETRIVRPRVQALHTFDTTQLPYVFLAASSVNSGDTVVRRGEVIVEKPSLVLPFGMPQFEGFKFEDESDLNPDLLMNFFLVRGIRFPSLRYNNRVDGLGIFEGGLDKAIEHHGNLLQRTEDVSAGLLVGPEDCWQLSILIFISSQIARSAEGDVKKLFEDYRKNGWNF
jgi:hypothetical protein